MAFIWWICFRLRGRVTSRTRAVKAIIAKPIWLKQMTYNTTRVLIMGRMITSFQRSATVSKPTLPCDQQPMPDYSHWVLPSLAWVLKHQTWV